MSMRGGFCGAHFGLNPVALREARPPGNRVCNARTRTFNVLCRWRSAGGGQGGLVLATELCNCSARTFRAPIIEALAYDIGDGVLKGAPFAVSLVWIGSRAYNGSKRYRNAQCAAFGTGGIFVGFRLTPISRLALAACWSFSQTGGACRFCTTGLCESHGDRDAHQTSGQHKKQGSCSESCFHG
jgi:hypothetical protein